MSWTFSTVTEDGSTASAEVRDAEFDDTEQRARRQVSALTQGGVRYTQDLQAEDFTLFASWSFLTPVERAALLAFFGPAGTRRQARPFDLTVTGGLLTVAIGTGMVIGGVALGTGQGYNTGQGVVPSGATLAGLHLDQPDLQFVQQRNERFSLSLRFRRVDRG